MSAKRRRLRRRAAFYESKNNIASGTPGVRVQTVNVNLVVQKEQRQPLHFDENESQSWAGSGPEALCWRNVRRGHTKRSSSTKNRR